MSALSDELTATPGEAPEFRPLQATIGCFMFTAMIPSPTNMAQELIGSSIRCRHNLFVGFVNPLLGDCVAINPEEAVVIMADWVLGLALGVFDLSPPVRQR